MGEANNEFKKNIIIFKKTIKISILKNRIGTLSERICSCCSVLKVIP